MSDNDDLGHLGYREDVGLFGPGPSDSAKRYYGKYRGTVVNNIDLTGHCRLLVRVPDVSGFFVTTWALPCVPMAGPQMGTYFTPPPIGAGVWVEFEQGDPGKPIWVGCFWDGPAMLPGTFGKLSAMGPGVGTPAIVLETLASGVAISTVPLGTGTVNLYSGPEAAISIGPQGIILAAASVSIITKYFSVNGVQFTVV